MKRVLIIFLIIFFTGCSSNIQTINCRKEKIEDGLTVENNITLNAEDNIINSSQLKIMVKIADDHLKFQDQLLESLKKEYEIANNQKGILITFYKQENTNNVEINVNNSEADIKIIEKIFGVKLDNNSDINKIKDIYLKNGYYCQ